MIFVKQKYAALEKQNETLQTNISTLFKTAKAEISRKDRMYQDVQAQYVTELFFFLIS